MRLTCTGRWAAVRAKVMWQHKVKWLTWEMGLKFVGLDTRQMTNLEHLVILSRQRRTI